MVKKSLKKANDEDGDFVVRRLQTKDGFKHHAITIIEFNNLHYALLCNVKMEQIRKWQKNF